MGYWRFIKQDWALLGFGFLMAALSGPGQTYFVGLFRDEITKAFNISIGDFGLIFSSATLLSAAVFFWSGKFVDRWTVQKTTTIFALIFAGSAFLVGLAPHVAVLAIAIFGIRHVGQGLMGHISGTTMARFFNTIVPSLSVWPQQAIQFLKPSFLFAWSFSSPPSAGDLVGSLLQSALPVCFCRSLSFCFERPTATYRWMSTCLKTQ